VVKLFRRRISEFRPSMGLSRVENECRSGSYDHRSVVKGSRQTRDRMDALTAMPVEPLVVQDGIDRFRRRAQLASPRRPGIPKPVSSFAPAEKTGSMPRRESDGLIEEE
jgi:hypothetical protein